MASENKVILIGNITRDLELRYIPGGQAVVEFTIAVNQRFKDKAGQSQEKTDFIPIVVWGKQAENCKQYLAKGSSVYIEGRLQNDSWEAEDGSKRSKIKVVARRVQFLNRIKSQTAPAEGTNSPAGEPIKSEGDLSASDVKSESDKTSDDSSVAEENLDEEIPF